MANRGKPRSGALTTALVKFGAVGLLLVTAIGLFGWLNMRRVSTNDAINSAVAHADTLALGVIEPVLTDELLSGRPEAIRALDEVVHRVALRHEVIRIKLWTTDGRIVYSDKHELIGRTFPIDRDITLAVNSGAAQASISDLEDEENEFERSSGKLLQVYLPIHTPSGQTLIYEDYERLSELTKRSGRAWTVFVPLLLGSLLVLELAQLPMAYALGRRIRDGHRARAALVERALAASDNERKKITHDLHDGVVQKLIGVSYSLSAAINDPVAPPSQRSAEMLRAAFDETQGSINSLRTLLVDIYPPDLDKKGLAPALSDLLSPLETFGVSTQLRVQSPLSLGAGTTALVFRCASEAVRNVVAHAKASNVDIDVARTTDHVTLTVHDDGCGFDTDVIKDRPSQGHMGLRTLDDLIREAGGDLTITSADGLGTTVVVSVPA